MFGAKYAKPVDINGHGIVRPICICSLWVVLIKNHPLLWFEVEHRQVYFPLDPNTMIPIHGTWIKQFSCSDLSTLTLTKELLTTPGSIQWCGWSEVGGSVLAALSPQLTG